MKLLPLFLATATVGSASVLQTFTGPNLAFGGGDGVSLIDTSNDTGDWITNLNAGGTVFIGFDWTVDDNNLESGTGGFFGGLGVFGASGGDERLLAGNGWESLEFGGGQGAAITDTGLAYSLGSSARLVLELTVVDGGTNNDTWRLWVDPGLGDQGSPDAFSTAWNLEDSADFTRITHRAGNGFGQSTLENLVVATDFVNAAVPEATESSLIALGLAGLLGIRRRKRSDV